MAYRVVTLEQISSSSPSQSYLLFLTLSHTHSHSLAHSLSLSLFFSAVCKTGTNSPPNVHACTRPFGPIQIKLNYLTDFTPPLPFLIAVECYSILRPLRTIAMLKIYCLSADHLEVPKVSYSGGVIDGVDDD